MDLFYNQGMATPSEKYPLLIFGTVGALGACVNETRTLLKDCLSAYQHYEIIELKIADLIQEAAKGFVVEGVDIDKLSQFAKHHLFQTVGDFFCREGDAGKSCTEYWAIEVLKQVKEKARRKRRLAIIIHSFKRPAEIRLFREVFGDYFILVGSSLGESARRERLKSLYKEMEPRELKKVVDIMIKRDKGDFGRDAYEYLNKLAGAGNKGNEGLIEQTYNRKGVFKEEKDKKYSKYGQDVENAFSLVDYVVRGASRDYEPRYSKDPDSLKRSIEKLLEMLAGHPYRTPREEEYFMKLAFSASLMSADTGRQVGAVIVNPKGKIVSVGYNEVPKRGGGVYTENSSDDHRDFKKAELFHKKKIKELKEEFIKKIGKNIKQQIKEVLESFKDTQTSNLIEFFRSTHAEKMALAMAAYSGSAVQGATIYVTDFPCHLCTQMIIVSGVSRVVYFDPYDKSLADEMYPDEITINPFPARDDHCNYNSKKIVFESYAGVAPQFYEKYFLWDKDKIKRQNKEKGEPLKWLVPEINQTDQAAEINFSSRVRVPLTLEEIELRIAKAVDRERPFCFR
ncbi:MAG: hypothetical protein COZ46_01370 [Verrucomicrobia bacterium CG_4_10_14_3_um_filter_43_23]|nr:MAG: hypothetical protein COZ46_01370 [Verrucomicrobia bacterium CG_4_10_14_3_um_filter_43_23]PJA44859.1 MAG: hypothetical protein CO175_00860 [Verrucomicrobia bacterium CG_4_9_14_3_um_filter_43_20]